MSAAAEIRQKYSDFSELFLVWREDAGVKPSLNHRRLANKRHAL
jgi:hypothetical protein